MQPLDMGQRHPSLPVYKQVDDHVSNYRKANKSNSALAFKSTICCGEGVLVSWDEDVN